MKKDLSVQQLSPLKCLLLGAAAGAIGSAVQTLFFKATSPIKPETPKFKHPPDLKQRGEQETETVARRIGEGVIRTGMLSKSEKQLGATLVHFGFGAEWGALYGIVAESFPEQVITPVGAAAFGATVWMLSDNVLLPAVKLADWPQKYPAKNHAYALAAHLVYGATVWSSYYAAKKAFARRTRLVDAQATRFTEFDRASLAS